jgi:phosphohistidine phosphatase
VRVFIVRHAEAAAGDPDDLRRLTPTGRATARALGERLAEEAPAAVLTSPLLRARETGELVAKACDVQAEPDERLAPGVTEEELRAAVAGRGDTVVAVFHQPDCSEIVLAVTGRKVPFAPGAVQEIAL